MREAAAAAETPDWVAGLSPELRLAFACCGASAGLGRPQDITCWLPRVDATTFVDLVVRRHRIGPLVHKALQDHAAGLVPEAIAQPLAAEARANAHKALGAARTLLLLGRWFGDAGVTWLPFKGIALALRCHGDMALRQVNDLDLWVPFAQLETARRVLAAHGFRWDPAETCWDLIDRGPRHRHYLTNHFYQERHVSAEHGALELHWRLTDNPRLFGIAPEAMHGRCGLTSLAGAQIPVMDDVDLLLYLCEHGGHHCWYRLKWLADLPALLASRPWNWDDVLARAGAAGCRRSLLLGLVLARDAFGWTPPPVIADCLQRERLLGGLRHLATMVLTGPAAWRPARWGTMAFLAVCEVSRLIASPDWRALASQVASLSVSPHDLRELAVPDRWFGLYRVLRPLMFVRRFVSGRWQAQAT